MQNQYTCQSLPIAAWLSIRGHDFQLALDPQDPTRAVFLFSRDPDSRLDRDIIDFQAGGGSVAPQHFKGIEIKLRNEMFAFLRGQGAQR